MTVSFGAGYAFSSRVHGFTSSFDQGSCRSVICVSLFQIYFRPTLPRFLSMRFTLNFEIKLAN